MNCIVYDLLFSQPLGGAKYHGGGEYIKSVFKTLVDFLDKQNLEQMKLIVFYDKDAYIDSWVVDLISKKNIEVKYVKNVQDIEILLYNLNNIYDKIHFFTGMIYQYATINFPKKVYTIGVCHGLRPIEKLHDYNQWVYANNLREKIVLIKQLLKYKKSKNIVKSEFETFLNNFDVIVTDSKFSEYSIKINYSKLLANKKIFTYYAPIKYLKLDNLDFNNDENYIMMISANRWLKNCFRGIQAIDYLYNDGFLQNVKTRVYGQYPDHLISKIKNRDCFEFYGYVNDFDLENGYKNCSLFFYPTLNEGFGLPPLEAMKYGKTCLISAVASLPEVYGESVYYCNPYDIMEMSNRVLMSLENPIKKEKIFRQTKKIFSRQDKDIQELCKLIVLGKER